MSIKQNKDNVSKEKRMTKNYKFHNFCLGSKQVQMTNENFQKFIFVVADQKFLRSKIIKFIIFVPSKVYANTIINVCTYMLKGFSLQTHPFFGSFCPKLNFW